MNKNEQRRKIAGVLIWGAANLLEAWDDIPETEELDYDFAKECFKRWLAALPGDAWDTRLGEADS